MATEKNNCKTFAPNNVIFSHYTINQLYYTKEIRTRIRKKSAIVQLTAVYIYLHVLVPTMGFEPATSHTSIPQYTLYKFKHHDHYTIISCWDSDVKNHQQTQDFFMNNFQFYIRSHSVKSWKISEIFQIPFYIFLDCIQEYPRLLSDNLENFLDFSECDPK